ncbi:MAG TPA: divalent-cation tolerance protein CutA [Actinomycetota bacterium]|nr:divalent-cation tolerance protein CutA [Actinomycetota bacterium]
MEDCVQVLCAVDTRERAEAIAARLVEDRRAACVQVLGPVASTYRWRGAVERAEEFLLVAKTTREAYPSLERAIRALHPYEVPEITAVPVVAGSADYLGWVRAEVRP